MDRREQFGLSATKFSDEVYAYIEQLSIQRKLSDWVARQVEKELRSQGAPSGGDGQALHAIMTELLAIKQMVSHGAPFNRDACDDQQQPAMELLSSSEVKHILSDEDLSYDFDE
ncbi:hypothetical protein DFQ01_11067 [Paenibacillus cellulosilyticus]|uniref:Uncharacterized protein n=1 Tax=Paenibacillus cellulosilyticus TaxID=375489 RepID=A0A2V2YSK3_9BACL|nr:hypothetical protein [Paenibacillus cellulosilyticus]PWW01177.1 hypothetical protein DFQ01_11067 [Paenibacillus cellulosilyticus]QKS46863.1 hypothetical protein HUB94_20485 [Paenibacillus cellulosilyticus]